MLYSSAFYNDDQRDTSLYGALRPSVFASEPSFVGIFFRHMLMWLADAGFPTTELATFSLCHAIRWLRSLANSITTIFFAIGGMCGRVYRPKNRQSAGIRVRRDHYL
jgi:hypothetical protein